MFGIDLCVLDIKMRYNYYTKHNGKMYVAVAITNELIVGLIF